MAKLWRMIDPLLSARADGLADATAGIPSIAKIATFGTLAECREYGMGHLAAWDIEDNKKEQCDGL